MLTNLIREVSPEGELLLCCTRAKNDSLNTEKIKQLIAQDINWHHLLKLGEKHRVIPLIYTSLKSIDSLFPGLFRSVSLVAQGDEPEPTHK